MSSFHVNIASNPSRTSPPVSVLKITVSTWNTFTPLCSIQAFNLALKTFWLSYFPGPNTPGDLMRFGAKRTEDRWRRGGRWILQIRPYPGHCKLKRMQSADLWKGILTVWGQYHTTMMSKRKCNVNSDLAITSQTESGFWRKSVHRGLVFFS